jgi:hypothetical protein
MRFRRNDPKSLFLERGLPRRSDVRRRVRGGDELAPYHSLWAGSASQDRLARRRHEKLAVDNLLATGGYPEGEQRRVVRHLAGCRNSTACTSRGGYEAMHYSKSPTWDERAMALHITSHTSATANSARDERESVLHTASLAMLPSGRAMFLHSALQPQLGGSRVPKTLSHATTGNVSSRGR